MYVFMNLGIVVVNIDSKNMKSPYDVHEVGVVTLGFLFSTSSLIIFSGVLIIQR